MAMTTFQTTECSAVILSFRMYRRPVFQQECWIMRGYRAGLLRDLTQTDGSNAIPLGPREPERRSSMADPPARQTGEIRNRGAIRKVHAGSSSRRRRLFTAFDGSFF
jgi:hypothetical protein